MATTKTLFCRSTITSNQTFCAYSSSFCVFFLSFGRTDEKNKMSVSSKNYSPLIQCILIQSNTELCLRFPCDLYSFWDWKLNGLKIMFFFRNSIASAGLAFSVNRISCERASCRSPLMVRGSEFHQNSGHSCTAHRHLTRAQIKCIWRASNMYESNLSLTCKWYAHNLRANVLSILRTGYIPHRDIMK